jgi:hypothetical protein
MKGLTSVALTTIALKETKDPIEDAPKLLIGEILTFEFGPGMIINSLNKILKKGANKKDLKI